MKKMKRIDIINAVANCLTLKKGKKLKAISFLSSEECKNMPPFKTELGESPHSSSWGKAIFFMFRWADTPLGGEFWQEIKNELDRMERTQTKEGV
jgi:hypothetical protein